MKKDRDLGARKPTARERRALRDKGRVHPLAGITYHLLRAQRNQSIPGRGPIRSVALENLLYLQARLLEKEVKGKKDNQGKGA